MSNTSHAVCRGSMHGRNAPNSFKQVVTAPLPNARQQEWVSRVLGDDHYKGLARVTVDVVKEPSLPNGHESQMSETYTFSSGRKPPTKTNKQFNPEKNLEIIK